jgi:hypothetical protein
MYIILNGRMNTYDHRIMKTRLPVRSALFKHDTGGLVVKWVTISESLLLYVYASLSFCPLSVNSGLSHMHQVLLTLVNLVICR